MKSTRIVLLSLLLATGVSAGEVVIVKTEKYQFVPAEVTVKKGTTVRWENVERRQYHSVYFEDESGKESDYFFPGESRERTFDKPGTYPYYCEPHHESHEMKGVVHVVE